MYQLRRVNVLSVAKISGLWHFCFGLLFCLLLLPFSILGGLAGQQGGGRQGAFAAAFGVGFVVIMPVFYAVFGLLLGALGGAFYNFVAERIGGIEFELMAPPTPAPPPEIILPPVAPI